MPYNFSGEFVDRLLDKLGSDDDFRARFQTDPRAAVESLGHKPAPEDARDLMCLKCTELASPAQIKASRGELRKQLLSGQASHSPINLEVAAKR
jgi:putative modified peptide